MKRLHLAAVCAVIAIASGLSGCGTLSRPPEGAVRLAPNLVTPAHDPRSVASDSAALAILRDEFTANSETGPSPILALSGGGANGAYGAGVLVGWTQSGQRPPFKIVTGVSTGALTAPFAFLGPRWDPQLQAAYASGEAKGILSWRQLATFALPSLYSASALRRLVDHAVSPAMLQEIAAEHDKGRRLLVATTNLDTQETVIWDMGLIAKQGSPQGLALFKNVLVASASIPGVFPPVLIAGRARDGRTVQDMHVDGGVNLSFLAVPESLLLWTRPNTSTSTNAIYVVVNGQIGRVEAVTQGRLKSILKRTFDSSSKASIRSLLTVNAAFAERNGFDLEVSAVPDDAEADSLDFSRESMVRLFELGRDRAVRGGAWAPWTQYLAAGPLDAGAAEITTPSTQP